MMVKLLYHLDQIEKIPNPFLHEANTPMYGGSVGIVRKSLRSGWMTKNFTQVKFSRVLWRFSDILQKIAKLLLSLEQIEFVPEHVV